MAFKISWIRFAVCLRQRKVEILDRRKVGPRTSESCRSGPIRGVRVAILIRNNLWQVGGRGLSHPSDAAVYLLRIGNKGVLIDAGTGRSHPELIQNIAECMKPDAQLEYILLTHCHFDHAAGARFVRKEYGCKIVAHELDAFYLESGDDRVTGAARHGATVEPFDVDIKLRGPESAIVVDGVTLRAIHCPGHSPGSVVYTVRMDGEIILFGQDVHGPIRSELLSNEEHYLASLAMLLNLDADLLLEGHFGVIETKSEVREFIQNCINPAPEPCRC